MLRLLKFVLLVWILSPLNLYGQRESKVYVELSGGISSQHLNWSIAGNSKGSDPNVFSELIWENLLGSKLSADIRYNFYRRFFYTGGFNKSFVLSGKVSDQDYAEDNRQGRTYAAFLKSNKGYSWIMENHLGFSMIQSKSLQVEISLGHTVSCQSFFLVDGKEESSQEKKLNSNYKTRWEGLGARLLTTYYINNDLSVDIGLGYQQLDYFAQADWNLIDAFAHPVSFEHKAKGNAFELFSVPKYAFNKAILAKCKIGYYNAGTGRGVDRVFLVDGDQPTTQLNEVEYKILSAELGLIFCF